eukprot:3647986-Prymnesium_polylepis.1
MAGAQRGPNPNPNPHPNMAGAQRGRPAGVRQGGARLAWVAPHRHHVARRAPVAPRHTRAHQGHPRDRARDEPRARAVLLARELGRRHL